MKPTFHLKEVHATIQKASGKLKHILRDHDATREALNTVRDEIQNEIEKFADNVKVVIYLDKVLDGSIEIRAGRAENQVRVSIKSIGDIKYHIKKTLLEKVWNFVKTEILPQKLGSLKEIIACMEMIKKIGLVLGSFCSESEPKQQSEDTVSA